MCCIKSAFSFLRKISQLIDIRLISSILNLIYFFNHDFRISSVHRLQKIYKMQNVFSDSRLRLV